MENNEEKKDKKESNGTETKSFEWQKIFIDIGRTFGVPTVLLLLLSYWLLWQVTPPLMKILTDFLTSTIETQTILVKTQSELAQTQADIASSQQKLITLVDKVSVSAEEIKKAEQDTQKFMQDVETIHKTQIEKLDSIEKLVKPK